MPDFTKDAKKPQTPEEHLTVNAALNLMTAIVSITLAILLFSLFLGKENTPVIIYVTAAFLIAIFAWQIQTFTRTLKLKKHFKSRKFDKKPKLKTQLLFSIQPKRKSF